MNKKKGFTLIELLAIIVILAIIAVITVPIVLGIIDDAKKGSAVDSVYGYIDAIETNNALAGTSNEYTLIESTDDVNTLDVKVSGLKPTSGSITVTNGRVTNANLVMNGFTCTYDGEKVNCDGESTPVAYYEYGEPTTSSTTDYTTLGKNVFVKLEGEQKSVCIVRNGELSCLKNNNYTEYSSSLLTTGFAGMRCNAGGSTVRCNVGTFDCRVNSLGDVRCDDLSAYAGCFVSGSGSVDCD